MVEQERGLAAEEKDRAADFHRKLQQTQAELIHCEQQLQEWMAKGRRACSIVEALEESIQNAKNELQDQILNNSKMGKELEIAQVGAPSHTHSSIPSKGVSLPDLVKVI